MDLTYSYIADKYLRKWNIDAVDEFTKRQLLQNGSYEKWAGQIYAVAES